MKWKALLIGICMMAVIIFSGLYYLNTKIPLKMITLEGSGGCKEPDCENFCQENPQELTMMSTFSQQFRILLLSFHDIDTAEYCTLYGGRTKWSITRR